jgi:hypothetical protein
MVGTLQHFLQANDDAAVGVGIEVFDALVALVRYVILLNRNHFGNARKRR